MDLREAVLKRRSIRVFKDEPVPVVAIEAMKEACLWAPSAGNIQARRFWFVTDPDTREALGACSYQAEIFSSARLVVVGCTSDSIVKEYGDRGLELYAPQDVAAAVQNLLLVVHASGLGAVWVGAFDPDKVRRLLDLPDGVEAVAMVPVGVPAERPAPPEHLSANELFHDVD